jgi:hypothetical protein
MVCAWRIWPSMIHALGSYNSRNLATGCHLHPKKGLIIKRFKHFSVYRNRRMQQEYMIPISYTYAWSVVTHQFHNTHAHLHIHTHTVDWIRSTVCSTIMIRRSSHLTEIVDCSQMTCARYDRAYIAVISKATHDSSVLLHHRSSRYL